MMETDWNSNLYMIPMEAKVDFKRVQHMLT